MREVKLTIKYKTCLTSNQLIKTYQLNTIFNNLFRSNYLYILQAICLKLNKSYVPKLGYNHIVYVTRHWIYSAIRTHNVKLMVEIPHQLQEQDPSSSYGTSKLVW